MASAPSSDDMFDEFLSQRGHDVDQSGWEESYNKKQCLIAAAFTSRQRHSARCVAGHRYGKDTPLSRLSTLHPIAAVLTRKPTVRSLPGCASLRLVSGQQRLRQSGLYHVAQKGSGESLCGQPTVGGWCVGGPTGS